jgi:hypothetical protein
MIHNYFAKECSYKQVGFCMHFELRAGKILYQKADQREQRGK